MIRGFALFAVGMLLTGCAYQPAPYAYGYPPPAPPAYAEPPIVLWGWGGGWHGYHGGHGNWGGHHWDHGGGWHR